MEKEKLHLINISAKCHRRLKVFCARHGLTMRDFTIDSLNLAMDQIERNKVHEMDV